MVTIQVETWASFYPDSKAVFPLHWQELALHQDEIPLCIDEAKYETLEKAGILMIVTARCDGRSVITNGKIASINDIYDPRPRLVGYYLWFIMPHPHYSNAGPMGITDMYFVLPQYRRGTGAKLFIQSEVELRKRGVVKAITSCKVHEDHTEFLERLGYTFSDRTFVKLLKGGA